MSKGLKLALGGAIVVVLLAAGITALVNATKQPTADDFRRFDTQRTVLDLSMNVYNPLTTAFTRDYLGMVNESRSSDDRQELLRQYTEAFERDKRVNEDRLSRMAASPALKNSEVKEAFEEFQDRYTAVIAYYAQELKNRTNITESVAGKCAVMNKLNVATDDFAKNYTEAADACLQALKKAQETSDDTTDTLLKDVESIIKDRRDKFNAVGDGDEFEERIAQLTAIISLLGINSDVTKIQNKYLDVVTTKNEKLVKDANTANEKLEEVVSSLKGEA